MSSPWPGTSPCTAATVDRRSSSASASHGQQRPAPRGARSSAASASRRRPSGSRPADGRRPARRAGPQQREQEARPRPRRRTAAPSATGVSTTRERQPAPGHAAERPAAAQHLDRRPTRRRTTAARAGAAGARAESEPERRVEQRLEQRQRDPGGDADGAHPDDVGEVERRRRTPARAAKAPAQPAARGWPATKAGDGERDQPRQRHRLERERAGPAPRRRRRAGGRSTGQRYLQGTARRPCRGRRGPAALRTSPTNDWLPWSGCCLGGAGPSAPRSRGAHRPPRPRSFRVMAPHPPTRPLGLGAPATICMSGRRHLHPPGAALSTAR